MISSRIGLAVSLALLTTLSACAADTDAEDPSVLRAALCPPFVGAPGVLVSTTLDTSRTKESPPREAARMGLSEEYVGALKNLRARNYGTGPLPGGFTCPSFKIVPRSDLASWYEHGDWKSLHRAFPGVDSIREVSLPGYNQTRDRAIVEMALSCGLNCGSDDFILLRKTNGKWERMTVSESATS